MKTDAQMIDSSARKRLPLRTGFYYGWVIVALGGLGVFFSGPGQTYSNAVFIESYIRDFQLDRTTVSSIYSAATLISGLLLYLVGRLIDRFGRRVMLTAAALLLGLACMFNSYVTGPIMLFFGFFMVRYFGQGFLPLISTTLVSQWFVKYRGRALSFFGLGILLGAAIFPPAINALIDAYGWQTTWRILGALLIFLFAPIAFYFVRNRPEDVGLLPDGAAPRTSGGDAVPAAVEGKADNAPALEDNWTLSEAMRTKTFWLLIVCSAIPALIYNGIIFQIFSILGSQGVNRVTIAFVLSLVQLVSFGCSIVSGFIAERVRVSRMIALAFILNMVVPLLLMFAQTSAMVMLFAVSWGIAQGFMYPPMNVIWPNYFGRHNLGSIQSVMTTAIVIGSAFGPIPFGWAYDRFGTYNAMLAASIVVFLVGAILAMLAMPPRRKPKIV